jgi:hypothetical protein
MRKRASTERKEETGRKTVEPNLASGNDLQNGTARFHFEKERNLI